MKGIDMHIMTKKQRSQQGAVSLFVVIFTTLLITVVTVSFIRIMVQDQRQATDTDLSQSAYDSALAGVEDAKRVLLKYQNECVSSSTSETDCSTLKLQVESSSCNQGLRALGVAVDGPEVAVQKSVTESNDLDQAYTCVTINPYTDYYGVAMKDSSKIIPLRSEASIHQIKIEWYLTEDMPSSATSLSLITPSGSQKLLNQTDWQQARPSLLRLQLIDPGTNLALDTITTSSLFLYPAESPIGAPTGAFPAFATRMTKSGSDALLQLTACSTDSVMSGGYACTTRITLPRALDPNSTALLRLAAFYNKTNYRVQLIGTDGAGIKFSWVQPEVDSTGRANDLFRRVRSHVDMDSSFPYPEAALESGEQLCKDFTITDNVDDYAIRCEP